MMDAALNLEQLAGYDEIPALEDFWGPEATEFSAANPLPGWAVDPAGYMARAVALHQKGNLRQAQQMYKRILNADPDHSDALHLSGVIAYQIGKHNIAASLIARAIHTRPDHPVYTNNLGSVFQAQQQLDKAMACFHKALRIRPDYAEATYNMGNVLVRMQKFREAAKWYQKALALDPGYLDACYNLANCHKKMRRFSEALSCYRRAIDMDPGHAASYNNMGNVYRSLNRWEEAVDCFRKVLELRPESAEACYNLAQTLQSRGDVPEAVSLYQQSLERRPDYAEAYHNLGSIFKDQGLVTDALFCFRKALSLSPESAEAVNNMGNCCKSMGRLADAAHCYQTALEMAPGFAAAHSNYLYSLNFQEGGDPDSIFQAHRSWARQHAGCHPERVDRRQPNYPAGRRLRIGYVSPDFRRHSVAYFLRPLLSAHDHSAFKIYGYSDVTRPDAVTAAIRRSADGWRDISPMTDEAVAAAISEDRIDILIDLAGHTANNRMRMFARKPAPVQIAYLGYPNTTGLAAMDFRITDSWADPPGMTDHLYTETLIRMPSGFLCYQPDPDTPEISGPPSAAGGAVTFGSFHQRAKITPAVIRVWSAILARVPNAGLLMKSRELCDTAVQEMTAAAFADNGIAPERIRFCPYQADDFQHLKVYESVDISLDTFPYNGTTTTCEALWMGVPVIALAGRTHAARVGVSLLSGIGKTELIAESVEDYIRIGVELAGDLNRLAMYRKRLRQDLAASKLMNPAAFCRCFEQALLEAWKRHSIMEANRKLPN